jgi:GxxExxY protein
VKLKHADTTERIIGVFFEVYRELGHGYLESVYERAMAIAVAQAGLAVQLQYAIPVWFRGQQVGAFTADLLVDDAVLVELKSARTLESAHEAQLLNYLRATTIEVGLLLNFGPEPQFKRLAFDNDRKTRWIAGADSTSTHPPRSSASVRGSNS